ncbi:MAG: phage tail protein [Rhodospirillaceae bacterium]
MAEAVASVASIVAGGAASAAVGGGVIGAVVGGIVSVGVSYVAREIMGPTQPQQRSYPTPTPPPPRIYTPPPAPAPVPVVRPAPYQAPYQAPYHTQSVAPSLAPTLAGGGLTQMMRQPVTAHRIVYGEVRVGGPVVYLHTRAPEGSDKLDILHLVVVLAAHEVDSIGDIFLSDQVVALDDDGAATGEPFKRGDTVFARFRKHLGAANQAADSVLIANSDGQWTGANRLAGRAYVHGQLTYDDKAFPAGIPNLSALVRGRKLYDPRTGATAWSDNPALVVLDYLMAPWGLAAPLAEIDVTSFIAAANICDETVERPGGFEKRYTCNGVLDVSQAPQAALPPLLTSCAGRLTYTAGRWRLFAGAYLPPMTAFSEADARDTVTVKPRRSRRDLINTVRGTFISPAQNWQPTDYPPVCVAAYKASDGGEEVAENLDLPYTRSPYMAQRIARIALETCRRELTVQLPANLAGLRVVAGETVTLTLSRFNIVQVPMVVVQWQLTEDLGVNLTLHREDPDIYAIALGDLVAMPAPAAVSLPGNQDIPPATPSGLNATLSGNAVRLTWSAVAEPDFSHFEVYEGPAGSGPDAADRIAEPYASTWFRDGLPGGASRAYRVRAVDNHGNRSAFAGPVTVTVSTAAGAALVLE